MNVKDPVEARRDRLTGATRAAADSFFQRAWPSYAFLVLLQLRILWGAWEFRDLTAGDTSSYFLSARLWASALRVVLPWSPAYTAYYGSFLWLDPDPYLATTAHRLALLFVAGVAILWVFRQVVPPHVALVCAIWWASMPIVFNTLYEVHLFAILPMLAYWALVLGGDGEIRRAAALGVLAGATVLVRNELLFATFAAGALFALVERERRRRGAVDLARLAMAYGSAGLAVIALAGVAYWRSSVQLPELKQASRAKHVLNMNQGFAYAYQERHPEWTKSPWTEWPSLATQVFAHPSPTLGEMISRNPRAVAEHLRWNLGLVPAGIEALLFNATSSAVNPDFVPVKRTRLARPVSFGAALLCAGAGLLAWREARSRSPQLSLQRLSLAIIPPLASAAVVAIVQRPRPSYLFSVGLIGIAAICWSLDRLGGRIRGFRLAARPAVLALASIVFVVTTPHFARHPSKRPLRAKVEQLRGHLAELDRAPGQIVLGEFAGEAENYAGLTPRIRDDGGALPPLANELWSQWDESEPLGEFLRRRGVGAVYFDAFVLAWMRRVAAGRELLERPGESGFRLVGSGDRGEDAWMLVTRE